MHNIVQKAMSDTQRNTIIRFAIIYTVIAIGFLAVLIKIGVTQTIDRKQLLAIASRQVSRNETIPASRGNIFDCSGRLLAGSAPQYYIYMDTRVPALSDNDNLLFNKYIDSISDGLSNLFQDRTAAQYKQTITNAFYKGNGRLRIYPKRITYSQLKELKALPLFNQGSMKSGLIVESRYQRIKPFGSLASRTIGSIYGETGKGNSGLEMQFEEYLHGKDGQKTIQMVDGRVVSVEDEDAIDGMDIITTLDANLQDVVESQLRQTLNRLDADWGCCILMEVKSGKVRAMSNLGRTAEGNYIEDKNYAVSRIEPGSTFKTYALMAAMDDGKVSIDDTIDVEKGLWYYEKAQRPIRDSHIYKDKQGNPLAVTRFTVKEVLATSSNVGLAKIVTSAYEKKASKFVDKLDKMGVRETVPFDIPGTQQPKIDDPNDGETLARMAFGYYVELPPIDILMFYNAIANNGKMIRPYIVSEIQKDGITHKRFSSSTVSSSICKSSTLRDIRECLEAVVWDNKFGTASVNPWGMRKAQSDIVHIAGKTGTAQVLEKNGKYNPHHHRTLFCGYYPMDNPKYTCICVIQQKEQAIYDAGFDCGGTVRRIAEKTMAYHSSTPVSNYAVDPDSIVRPTIKRGLQRPIHIASKGTKIKVKSADSQWIRVNEQYEAVPLQVSKNIVPDVIGMGAKDAIFAIEQTGMLVSVHGKGKVVSQSVSAGEKAIKGANVILELK